MPNGYEKLTDEIIDKISYDEIDKLSDETIIRYIIDRQRGWAPQTVVPVYNVRHIPTVLDSKRRKIEIMILKAYKKIRAEGKEEDLHNCSCCAYC